MSDTPTAALQWDMIAHEADCAILAIDMVGTITAWNRGAASLFGFTADEVLGRSVLELVPESVRDQVDDVSERIANVRGGEPYITQYLHKEGHVIDVALSISTLHGADGAQTGLSIVGFDLTAVRRSEFQRSALLEAAPDAIVVVGENGTIQLANRRANDLFGYTGNDLVGQPLEVLLPKESRERHPHLRRSYFEDPQVRPMGRGLHLSAVRRDGTEFPVDISLAPLDTPDGMMVSAAVRDISDQREAEAALRLAKEEAERANRAKSDFLSRMSHELRTPLTAILGFTELLQMSEVPEEQRASFIERTQRAGQHLLALINDVLDISRVESGNLSLSIEPVRLDLLIEEAVDLIEPIARRRGVVIHRYGSGAVVAADLNRSRQVLLNLLSNAVKYNKPGGSVTLDVRPEADHWELSVTDTGRGIAKEDMHRLFEPFERLGLDSGEIENAAEVDGTGIGLALTRGLVEAMGGKVSVESELGVGSRFIVHLPRTGRGPDATHPSPTSTMTTSPQSTVLYIEDNPSNTVLVESAFALRSGVRLLAAGHGSLGLEMAREHRPDLILLDLHLPDLRGEEVLARLRSDRVTADIPVIVVSADATKSTIRDLMDAGAHAYITKPLVISDFLEAVDRALAH